MTAECSCFLLSCLPFFLFLCPLEADRVLAQEADKGVDTSVLHLSCAAPLQKVGHWNCLEVPASTSRVQVDDWTKATEEAVQAVAGVVLLHRYALLDLCHSLCDACVVEGADLLGVLGSDADWQSKCRWTMEDPPGLCSRIPGPSMTSHGSWILHWDTPHKGRKIEPLVTASCDSCRKTTLVALSSHLAGNQLQEM